MGHAHEPETATLRIHHADHASRYFLRLPRFLQSSLPTKDMVESPNKYTLVDPKPVEVTASSTAYAFDAANRQHLRDIYPHKAQQLQAAKEMHKSGIDDPLHPKNAEERALTAKYARKADDLTLRHLKAGHIHLDNSKRVNQHLYRKKSYDENFDLATRRKETSEAVLQLTDPTQAPYSAKQEDAEANIHSHSKILLSAASDMGFHIALKESHFP